MKQTLAQLIIALLVATLTTFTSCSRIQNNFPLGVLPQASSSSSLGASQGYIDVQMMFADFGSLQAEAYMIVCLIANGAAEPRLPISNYKQTCTLVCSGPQSNLTSHPVWRKSCLPSRHETIFQEDRARTVLEVWDSTGNGTHNKRFLGGNSITVTDLLRGNLNGQPWQFGLYGGAASGYGVVRINWTPKRMNMVAVGKRRRSMMLDGGY